MSERMHYNSPQAMRANANCAQVCAFGAHHSRGCQVPESVDGIAGEVVASGDIVHM